MYILFPILLLLLLLPLLLPLLLSPPTSLFPDREKSAIRQEGRRPGAKVGGGGKMALPGLESAKNPTGMSLITQRYTL